MKDVKPFLAGFLIAAFVFAAIWGISANTNILNLHGSGKLDMESAVAGTRDRVMTQDAYINLKISTQTDGPNTTETIDVIISGADGTLYDRVEFIHKGAGDKVVNKVVKIDGDMDGSADYTYTKTPSGDASLNSEISIDLGNATGQIYLRVWNSSSGRPASEMELDAVGNYTYELVHNKSSPQKKAEVLEAWLGLCAELDRPVILDTTAGGVYVAPAGYDVVDGQLVPNSTSSEEPIAYDVWDPDGTHRTYNQGPLAITYANGTRETSIPSAGMHMIMDADGNPVVQNTGLSGTGRIEGTGTGDGTGHINHSVYR